MVTDGFEDITTGFNAISDLSTRECISSGGVEPASPRNMETAGVTGMGFVLTNQLGFF